MFLVFVSSQIRTTKWLQTDGMYHHEHNEGYFHLCINTVIKDNLISFTKGRTPKAKVPKTVTCSPEQLCWLYNLVLSVRFTCHKLGYPIFSCSLWNFLSRPRVGDHALWHWTGVLGSEKVFLLASPDKAKGEIIVFTKRLSSVLRLLCFYFCSG